MSHLFIGAIAPALILLPVSVAVLKFAQMPLSVRQIFYYLLGSGCINLIAILLANRGIINLPLLHLLTLVELYFLLKFYSTLFEGNTTVIIKYTSVITILASLANSIWLQNIYKFNSYARALVAISIILLSLLYFIKVPENKKVPAELVIVYGLLLYYAGSFFLFLFSNYLKSGLGSSTMVWNINAALLVIFYLFITAGILKCNQQPTTSIS
jgi:hypothetical protein